MSVFTTLLILFLLIFIPGTHNSAYGVDEAEIANLVMKLGAESFEERNRAADSLLKIGKPASKVLKVAMSSRDPEIRMRSKKLLEEIKLGIHPDWSKELQQKVRGYDKLDKKAKSELLDKLSEKSEDGGICFLLVRIEKADPSDVQMAMKRLLGMKDLNLLWETVLAWEEPPSNKYQARLLAEAAKSSGKLSDVLKALESKHLEEKMKTSIVDSRIAVIDEYLQEKEYEKAERETAVLAKVLPDNAILLYIQADALAKMGKNYQSVEIENKALDLNPESESAHYKVATKLTELGKLRLAEKEWKTILDIPPDDTVYDINAYLRISDIYEKSKLYSKALDALKTGVKKYKEAKEKNGSGMGMVGADKLDDKIKYLEKMALEKGDASGMQVMDPEPKNKSYLKCNLNIIVKDDKHEEMVAELKNVERTMSLNVKPPGLKLLKKKVLKLKYDSDKLQFSVMLNNHPCSVEKNFELKEPTAKVAVIDQDVCNIYRIDRDSEKVELLKSYERDYQLIITKGEAILSWRDTVVKVNNKEYPWKDLKAGIPYDILPDNFKIDLKGITPSGKEKSITHTIAPGGAK